MMSNDITPGAIAFARLPVGDAAPIGGIQHVWLSMLEGGPRCSAVAPSDRRCLVSLERRGFVEQRRPGAWYITDAGRRARLTARILADRPRPR